MPRTSMFDTLVQGFHRVLAMWDEISAQLGPETTLVLGGDARLGDPNQLEYKKELLELVLEYVDTDLQ